MAEASSPSPADDEPGVSGKVIVLVMFAFAVVMTGTLWTYSYYHQRPFQPLRRALAAEFGREIRPRVEGGQNKGGPWTLRVILTVDFDPNEQKPETAERLAHLEERIRALAAANLDMSRYEVLEMYFVNLPPEAPSRRLELKRDLKSDPQRPAAPGERP